MPSGSATSFCKTLMAQRLSRTLPCRVSLAWGRKRNELAQWVTSRSVAEWCGAVSSLAQVSRERIEGH